MKPAIQHPGMKIWALRIMVYATLLVFVWMSFDAYRSMHGFYASGGADFKIYRTAAVILKQSPQRLYDYGLQTTVQQELYPRWPVGNDPLPYNHFPVEAVIFLPLAGLSNESAYYVWQTINLLLLLAALWMVRDELKAMRGV